MSTSKYTGVTYSFNRQGAKKWKAQIFLNGTMVNLGHHLTERDAALAYDKRAIKEGKTANILKPLIKQA